MNEIEKIARRLVRKCVSEVDGNVWFDRTKAAAIIKEVLAAATKRAEEAELLVKQWQKIEDELCKQLDAAEQENAARVKEYQEKIGQLETDKANYHYKWLNALEREKGALLKNARLREAISQTWKECDEARMSEVEDARKEADDWKAKGDFYGWNFHQGRAAGMVSASIIYHRIERAVLPK